MPLFPDSLDVKFHSLLNSNCSLSAGKLPIGPR